MEVVAQWIRTSWTKQSRGGVAAARRNAVPVGLPLPTPGCPLTHEVLVTERSGFVARQALVNDPPDWDDLLLDERDGRLGVQLVAVPHGLPKRWRRPPAVRLDRGQWLRWQVNYRFSGGCCGEWSYQLDTLNLAYGPVPANIFTGVPHRHVDERAMLY